MDEYKLYKAAQSTAIDITKIVGGLTWKDNVDTLGMELSFDRIFTAGVEIDVDIVVGDKLFLMNNNSEVWRGIVTDEGFSGKFGRSFTCYDYAFYLNKNEIVIQFNGVRADTAIKQLCSKVGVPIGSITAITTSIKKIYKDATPSDIIKDILDQAQKELGTKYRMEMRAGKLYIENYVNLIVKATYQPAFNLASYDSLKSAQISGSRSIADMKNSIKIVSTEEDSSAVLAEASDSTSINKYGLLQAIESIDKADSAKARNQANNLLAELNRIMENFTLEMMGSDLVRAGRVMYIEEADVNLAGYYLVKECQHQYFNGSHVMQCEMGVA